MGRQARVSAVVPTYNRGYIIGEAVASVLNQSYADVEVIVVDDASTDDTREVVEKFKSEKVRYIRHERNRGCSAAYNTGITAATGQLVGILDSDDAWKPDYLQKLVGFLEEHPEADIVFCDTEIHGGEERIPSLMALMKSFPRLLQANPGAYEYIFTARQMHMCLLEEVPIKPSAVVIRRELFDKAGIFDEARPSGGESAPLVPFTDWELFLRFSHSACFGYINEPLVIQRRGPDAAHLQFHVQDKLFLLDLFLKEKAQLKNDREALLAVNRGISDHCTNLGGEYLGAGQRKKSLTYYLKGFKETREPMMLARAASALMPTKVREMIKGVVRGTDR